jgi:hypothetical protein
VQAPGVTQSQVENEGRAEQGLLKNLTVATLRPRPAQRPVRGGHGELAYSVDRKLVAGRTNTTSEAVQLAANPADRIKHAELIGCSYEQGSSPGTQPLP